MKIVLGIESSCDETAISAGARGSRAVLSHALATQRPMTHAPYGGVVPEIAARAHLAQIDRLYVKALALRRG
jgi:N6-L-threonylcarbamoyladenine synthase